ncbi:hypothetical protein C8D91_2664 [Marinicella litoralis]|uniref:Uncharacterized protein n=1 Tax=Marinicella litoralis TaxID=644220 RepID=A0A4R6XL45_9GAMM|nr:hypothetical protein C8D91_2664 [Marinicella litoralis]
MQPIARSNRCRAKSICTVILSVADATNDGGARICNVILSVADATKDGGARIETGSEIEGSRLRSKHPKDLPTQESPFKKLKHFPPKVGPLRRLLLAEQ